MIVVFFQNNLMNNFAKNFFPYLMVNATQIQKKLIN